MVCHLLKKMCSCSLHIRAQHKEITGISFLLGDSEYISSAKDNYIIIDYNRETFPPHANEAMYAYSIYPCINHIVLP